jgi:DNA-binding MarR family transcriptional regulator
MREVELPARERRLLRAHALLVEFSWALSRIARETLGEGNVGNRSVQLLLLLHQHPDLRPSEAAAALTVSRSTVSHMLDALELQRLVTRRMSVADRRAVTVSLTAEARNRVRRAEAELGEEFVARSLDLAEVGSLLTGAHGAEVERIRSPLEAGFALARAGAGFVAEVEPALEPYGVREFRDRLALSLLHERGPLRPVRLAEDLRLTRAGANAVIRRLSALGLVERTLPDGGGDRRAVLVALTPRGRDASLAVLDVFERHAAGIGAAMSACPTTAMIRGVA